jgi:hypothetical protein
LQAAYEAELDRISSAELLLQTAASLLNLGAHRLGLTGRRAQEPAPGAEQGRAEGAAGTGHGRDLEQVRDAIDGVRALMPILERRAVADLGPLRNALSQLQMAYAREAPRAAAEQPPAPAPAQPQADHPAGSQAHERKQPGGEPAGSGEASQPAPAADSARQPQQGRSPGPAESSGRLWVPGR